MLTKKRKLLTKVFISLFFSFLSCPIPLILSSCNKKYSDDSLSSGEGNEKSFFNEVIKNTSYYFSFDKDDYSQSSSFNLENNYSIAIKCKKDEINKFQKQQKFFLKFKCQNKFYLEKIGTIFCLPLITKIDSNLINENIKECQKNLFNSPIDIETDHENDNNEIKEITFRFKKEKIKEINKIENFDIGQKKYEIVFIISILSKSLHFKNVEELDAQKNNIGAKSANIFLHLKIEKSVD